jgi:predicted phosphodiesterase
MNNVVEYIKIDEYPLIIVTDIHSNLLNLMRIKQLYPNNNIICLGDIVNLWDKGMTDANLKITDYFIQNKIKCLQGNHDEWVAGNKNLYKITPEHEKYLGYLPILFVISLPDGKEYKCYHYRPRDFWSSEEPKNLSYLGFCEVYGSIDDNDGVIIGHLHKPFIINYPNARRKFMGVGSLKFGEYGVLTENGLEFKKL